MESRKTLLSLRWLSSSESLARIVSSQLHRGGRLVTCVLLLCLGFHFSLFTAHAQGPGLYKDGKKILDLGEMVDSSFQPAAAPRLEQTAGMKLFREVFGEKMPSKITPQKEYVRLVLECRDLVERMVSFDQTDSAFGLYIDRLLALEGKLAQANELLLQRFSQIEKSLRDNGYPAEKIDRHAEVVEGHTIAANRLSELLANLRSAHDSNDQASLEVLIQELKQYFIDNVFRKDPPLLSSQPLPVMMQVKEAPVVEGQLPKAIPYPRISKGERGPQKGDLDPTVDVQFTDDIIALAASLNNSPVEMYNYVRDNFEFEAYLGSRKGSQQTLSHKRGNDYDQASLLIALLRVSGIPARYATDSVQMLIDPATNWLGIDDPANAASILTTCGMEGVLNNVNDEPYAIKCRRVWVEAWLPFINYRGAVNDSVGYMWVPMDPTYKQYNYNPGINLPAEIGFDAEAFVFDYISTFHSETPVELFTQMLLDSLAIYHPEATYDDLITTRSVIRETDGILPGTLPYTLMSTVSTFSEIPSDKRYYIEFHLWDTSGMNLNYTTSLPEIVEKQLTISYVGATAADQEIIDTSGGIFNVDLPYLVDLKPVLKIDGCEVARGSGDVMMGTTHYSDMHFTAPTGASNQMPTVSNVIIAGNYQGIGIDTEDAFPSFWDLPETSCDEEYLGQEVHQTALTYLNNVDVEGDEAADLMHQVVMNDVSEAIVENSVTVLFSGGLPVSFEWTGMIVDADRKIIGPFSVDGADNDCDYMRLAGADGSIQENRVFETRYEEEAISAIKILELASDSGITICYITSNDIFGHCPGFSHPGLIGPITDALVDGHHIIIPERPFTYYNWTGTGYIDIDPVTCAAGYIISGGKSGGETVQEWEISYKGLQCLNPSGSILVDPPGDVYCADDPSYWTFKANGLKYIGKNEDGTPCQQLYEKDKEFEVTNYSIQQLANHPRFGPGEYVFRVGGPTVCTGCNPKEKTVTIVKVEITGFSIEPTWALGNGCDVEKHKSKTQATIQPAGFSALTYSIEGDAHGATIDAATGVVTPAANNSGEITVRAKVASLSTCYDEDKLLIRAHPTGITGTAVGVPNLNYGAKYTHTCSGTGGSLNGVLITEIIGVAQDDFNTGWPGVAEGAITATLNALGRFSDRIGTPSGLIDARNFLPSPPNPGLPAIMDTPQILEWRCPLDNIWVPFANVAITATLSQQGSNLVFTTVDNGVPHVEPYSGPAVLSNMQLQPQEVAADGAAQSNGSVDVIPQTRVIVWSIQGSALGATINANTGVLTAGNQGGQIMIRAAESADPSNFLQTQLTLVRVDNVVLTPAQIPADGTSTSQASATITPAGRSIVWSIQGNALGSTISSTTGVVTAGTQIGTITIRATDSNVPDAFAEGSLVLLAP